MPVTTSMTIDTKAAERFLSAVKNHAKENHKTLGHSLAWGGRKIMQSLGARTPKGKQSKRKVVENPNPKWKQDARMARFGVMVHSQTKQPNPRFVPIAGTGEFGKIRFRSKKTGEMLVWDKSLGTVRKQEFELGKNPDQIPGLMEHRKRNIARRGFAKKSWRYLQMRMGRGGYIVVDGIPRMGDVTWTNIKTDPTITINNRVTYIHKILQGGESAITNAMNAAASGMEAQIAGDLFKKVDKAK
jgi:hypothetical protein